MKTSSISWMMTNRFVGRCTACSVRLVIARSCMHRRRPLLMPRRSFPDILLDLRMPDMDGLEVQARLAELGVRLPVIVVSGHGDVATAVQAMKAGALDFLEKPIDERQLLIAIEAALAEGAPKARDDEAMRAVQRMAVLSPRERQVLEGIVSGKPNKMIAYDLKISIRTVEVHRTRLMVRLGTHSLAEAIRTAVLAALVSG
jgi:two-component system response regulator FixJ